ncbi:hypothetical protein GDO86_003669 [Hymenochirus boettgeri]|uniref:Uncharacterized protein n=1 Tax=Hymenochirus boettgeri TaxID=247094 RepID=A0A8T2KAE1_9PIPI|nr:hypothetical protein GDO86_003669 [Hymenochirus boettgeri]
MHTYCNYSLGARPHSSSIEKSYNASYPFGIRQTAVCMGRHQVTFTQTCTTQLPVKDAARSITSSRSDAASYLDTISWMSGTLRPFLHQLETNLDCWMMEGEEQLLRSVKILQAHVRGFIIRRKLQNVWEDYLAVVQEIEGDSTALQWDDNILPIPHFLKVDKVKKKDVKETVDIDNLDLKQVLSAQDSIIRGQQDEPVTESWHIDVQKKHPELSISVFDPNELELGNPEQKDSLVLTDQMDGFKRNINTYQDKKLSTTSLEVKRGIDETNSGKSWSDNNQQREGAVKYIQKVNNPGNSDRWLLRSKVLDEDIPYENLNELQQHRSHLAMEMLWVQQAIASRKNYLIVRRKLGMADR